MNFVLDLVCIYRVSDWLCFIKGNPAVWDCGSSPEEAMGNWLVTHGSDYAVRITKINPFTDNKKP